MLETFDAVKEEISNSVNRLDSTQTFHVIMFDKGAPLEKKPTALTRATDANKRALAEFLSKTNPGITTDPIKAVNRAFDVLARADRKPGKIIYLLTDGPFGDNKAVIAAVRKRNIMLDVTINTILCAWKPPEAVKIMTQIADENAGHYRYVNPNE
jgi:uncharacterized protein with von Willebrand factor type A (vWA) domain